MSLDSKIYGLNMWILLLLCAAVDIGASRVAAGLPCSHGFPAAPSAPTDPPAVIHSYNFPFNYSDNLNCTYDLVLPDHWTRYNICFTFHRFDLEPCGAGDYVTIGQYTYCGESGASSTPDVPASHDNVWNVPLCWLAQKVLIVRLVTDKSVTAAGFYATYTITAALSARPATQTAMAHSSARVSPRLDLAPLTPPCGPGGWACFSSRLCVAAGARCDGRADCPEGEDETYAHARCTHGEFGPSMWACDFARFSSCRLQEIGVHSLWRVAAASDDWRRGPTADHTTPGDSHEGAYAHTYFWEKPDEEADLYDPSVRIQGGEDYCLSFWYHSHGPDPGRLSVSLGGVPGVWAREGAYGDRWLPARLTIRGGVSLPVPGRNYFEWSVSRGGDVHALLAVDDISLTQGPCHVNDDISCTFELDTCGYVTVTSDGGGGWRRTRGGGGGGPGGDASPGGAGYYMLVEAADAPGAFLNTTVVHNQASGPRPSHVCLAIKYAFQCRRDSCGITSAALRVRQLYTHHHNDHVVQLPPPPPLATGGSADGQGAAAWRSLTYELQAWEPFKLVFEAILAENALYLAADEIQVIPGKCDVISPGRCSDGFFKCREGTCVAGDVVADGKDDCPDGSDEADGAACWQSVCSPSDVCCRNGRCVPPQLRCNGFNDCGDWTDEDTCQLCPEDRFRCESSTRCVAYHYRCNGVRDCQDGSDEYRCWNTGGGGGLHTGVIVGVACCAGILVIVLITQVVAGYYKQDSWVQRLIACLCRPCRRRRRQGEDANGEDTPPETPAVDPALFQPPDYDSAMNFPHPVSSATMVLPPSYDSVTKKDFVSACVTADPSLPPYTLSGHYNLPQPIRIPAVGVFAGPASRPTSLESPPPAYVTIPYNQLTPTDAPIHTPSQTASHLPSCTTHAPSQTMITGGDTNDPAHSSTPLAASMLASSMEIDGARYQRASIGEAVGRSEDCRESEESELRAGGDHHLGEQPLHLGAQGQTTNVDNGHLDRGSCIGENRPLTLSTGDGPSSMGVGLEDDCMERDSCGREVSPHGCGGGHAGGYGQMEEGGQTKGNTHQEVPCGGSDNGIQEAPDGACGNSSGPPVSSEGYDNLAYNNSSLTQELTVPHFTNVIVEAGDGEIGEGSFV